jgi:anti-sigma-K factor RskA
MDQNHVPFQENLPAYALGALDSAETAALEAHLQTCDTCRAELADYQRLGSGLLAALPPSAPRAAVKRNLQKRLAGQAPRVRPQFKWSFGRLAIATAVVVLVGLNLLTAAQVYSLSREQAELTAYHSSEQAAIAMLAYPTTHTLAFDQNGVSGSLLVDKQRNLLAVFAWNLALPPAGKTYQMWLIDPKGDRTSGGFIKPEADYPFVMAVIRSPQPLSAFNGIGITVEPLGGSLKPTGPRIIRVDF